MSVLRNRAKKTDPAARTRRQSPRKTAQISNAMLALLEERAAEEMLPLATVVRRAISRYVERAQRGDLPEISIDDERLPRRGQRGPAPQWPAAVSYVLDSVIAAGLEAIAAQRAVRPTQLAREALWLELAAPLPLKPAVTHVGHGFDTQGPSPTDTAEQEILNAVNDIRGRPDTRM